MNTQASITLPLPHATKVSRPQTTPAPRLNTQNLRSPKAATILFLTSAAFTLTPYAAPGLALALGTLLALTTTTPFPTLTRRLAKNLLQLSIILLGFSMNLRTALAAGRTGLLFAAASILATFALAHLLATRLCIPPKTSTLIAAGSAICGGSAIAAVASVIDAPESETSLAMATIFLLNALALYLFPPLGHALHLSPLQFGTWAGIAIHDVSSVVAAASAFNPASLPTATAVKLSRALWIVPVALLAAHRFHQPTPTQTTPSTHDFHPTQPATTKHKLHLPFFILGFLATSLTRTLLPQIFPPMLSLIPTLTHAATTLLTLTLFLIGTSISPQTLRSLNPRSLLQAALLWLFIATTSLALIKLTLP